MAIRLSGMVSGMDTESLVSALVSSYKLKKDNLVKAQTKLSWKQEKWKTMNTSIYGFYSGKLSSARFSTSYNLKTSSVSNDKYAKVSASSSAVSGTQRLKVKQLASTGYLTGGQIKAADGSKVTGDTKISDIVGTTDGSISFKTASGTKSIDITSDMNVNQFVSKLKEAGVNASFDENNARFFISSKESGKDNDFSLVANDSNGLNALQKLGIYTVNDTDSAEYKRLAALTEGSDAYNTELEGMYSKITAEDTAKSYADKYNAAKDKLDALAADDTWDHSLTLDEYVAKLKTETPDILNAYDKYKSRKRRGLSLDLKITPMQQLQQIEQAAKTSESDGSFRFTLLSTIEEQELQATLFTMMEEITQQGDKLGKRMDIRDMKNYRRLIKEFMNEIASHTHEFSRENFLDKKGRHRVYGIVKQINQTLDELAAELLKEEKDHLAILGKIDEIRGLILDIIT